MQHTAPHVNGGTVDLEENIIEDLPQRQDTAVNMTLAF
jgi:hypothetical protein